MNPLGRRTRHADDWASPHERARTRAAQWLDWPLDPAEAAWLEAHLTDCRSCRRRANEYLENRDRLRTLRDNAPPPPRDLWARTAAAIELESQRGRRAPVRGLPLGALSGIAVIVVVLGATLLSNTPTHDRRPADRFGSGHRRVRRGVPPAGAGRDAVPRGRRRRRIRPARPGREVRLRAARGRFGLPEEAGR